MCVCVSYHKYLSYLSWLVMLLLLAAVVVVVVALYMNVSTLAGLPFDLCHHRGAAVSVRERLSAATSEVAA